MLYGPLRTAARRGCPVIRIPFEDNPQLIARFRKLLQLPDDAELDGGDVVRAVELAQDAAAAVLLATADVLDQAFLDVATQYGVGFGDTGGDP